MNPCLSCGTPTHRGARCEGCQLRRPHRVDSRPGNRQAKGLGYQHQREARKLYGQPCVWCGEPSDTADHIIPRAHGGTSAPSNLQPACRSCNSRHGARVRRPPP